LEIRMAEQLGGKIAIVTGGASGLGRATVELFLKEGARVVIADVDKRGEALAQKLGDAAFFKQTDVTDAEQVQALVDFAANRLGRLDIMLNNAGIGGAMHERFLDDDLLDFQRVINVSLLGVMLGTRHAARHMARTGGGAIINTSSIAGIKAGFGVMSYRAAKAAVNHFTKCAAIDLAGHGIRVNCIAPGHIRTEMTAYAAPGMSAEMVERVKRAVQPVTDSSRPLKRQGTPEDFAQAALYLASDHAAQITGVVLPVDGGVTAGDPINHLQEILAARARATATATATGDDHGR
jgi:NAD(P)-dependent dehydrogenase (short-subunit alcohol dehydrogenase family)